MGSLGDLDCTFSPSVQSTPRTSKNLSCPKCGKKYQVLHYFRVHVKSCQVPVPTQPQAPSSSGLLNSSAVSVSFNLDDTLASNHFKTPAPPPPKPITKKKVVKKANVAPRFVCSVCMKGYMSKAYFDVHERTHKMQDAVSCFPDVDDVLENSSVITLKALSHVSQAVRFGDCGLNFTAVVAYVSDVNDDKWKKFSDSICQKMTRGVETKKVLLPSPLRSVIFDRMEEILSDSQTISELLDILEVPPALNEDSKSQFMLEFCLQVAQEIFTFIASEFKGSCDVRHSKKKKSVVLDNEDKQLIYYVAGSNMRGFLRLARRYSDSASWRLVREVLLSKALCTKPSDDQDASWTRSVDRGGLLYIKPACQKFFVALTPIVYARDKKTGIDYEDVIRAVSRSPVCALWDDIFEDSLSERMSLDLMNDVVKSFCRTCAGGFVKKRLNFLKSRPIISMPTRHAVARRKKT